MSSQSPPKLDWLSATARRLEFVPADYFAPIKLSDLFERAAPLEIDIGCGEGAFLLAMAARHPERNFLGIERLLGRVHTVCRAAAMQRLENVRVLRIENFYAVKHLLPRGSVAIAHILFPDPWPKRYHHRRRLIQEEFLHALHEVLAPAGELRVKTDDLPYFQWMEKHFSQAGTCFERLEWPDAADYPPTDFEQRFLAKGLPIYRARLRKAP